MKTIITVDTSCGSYQDWDMSTDKFPLTSCKGDKFYGINGPTLTLVDRRGNEIPSEVWLTALKDNASQTDPLDWSLEYTIN